MKTQTFPFYRYTFVFCLFLALCPAPCALGQTIPQGFNYQAVVRDGVTKQPLISESVVIRITIENAAHILRYQETHSVVTDELGAVALIIGNGTPTGAYVLSDVDWKTEQLYIKTELQHPVGNPYTDMGTAALMSVPYAMVADGFTQPLEKLTVEGTTLSHEEPIFEVKNKDGKTVLAVYNEGVRIFVGDGAGKGVKGGFAIGGFGSDKDENTEKYLWVDDDSVRVYINDAAKSAKGGFAIGGYGTKKGVEWPRYLKVTSDSTRVVTTNNDQGFGVGSGSTGSYLRMTPENYFIGHSAGRSISLGKYNSFIGYEAGKKTSSGAENIFIGYQSGLNNETGKWNTFLGYKAGMTNTGSDNTFIGYMAGSAHESQGGNVYIGSKAGQNATNGQQNVLIGESTGANLTTGSFNVMLGYEAGLNTEDGLRNVFLGYQAGWSNTLGRYNVFIGDGAGYNNIGTTGFPGNFNVFLGYNSGYNNITGQDNVFLGKQSGWRNITGSGNIYLGINTAGQHTNGSGNVFIGAQSAEFKTRGNNNVYLGYGSGGDNKKGSGNVFIGFNAGYNEQDSSLLYIENSSSSSPLIGGDFDADKVAINGKPDAAGATLQVNGTLRVGLAGTNIGRIIKASGSFTVPTLAAGSSTSPLTVTVSNTTSIGSTVLMSPSDELPPGLVLAYARISDANMLEAKFINASGAVIVGNTYTFYITVIQ